MKKPGRQLPRVRNLVRIGRRAAIAAANSAAYTSLIEKITGAPSATASGQFNVVLAPPGGGNLGDQSLLQSYLTNVDGKVTVLVRHMSNFDITSFDHNRVKFVAMPALIYGRGIRNVLAFRSFDRLIARANGFSVIGADIIDGAYNETASVNRIRTLLVARRREVSCRILGFSWNDHPTSNVVREIRHASEAGAELYVRDPASYRRMKDLHLKNVHLTADMVFLMRSAPSTEDQVLRRQSSLSRHLSDSRFVVLNASGMVGRKTAQTEAYVESAKMLLDLGYDVVLLPHVARVSGDDVAECTKVFDELAGSKGVHLVDGLLTPDGVKNLVERSEFVIAGRMHLSVIALSVGVPAAVVATQGKVEGLLALFGMEHLALAPDEHLLSHMQKAAMELHANRSSLHTEILRRLTEVRSLAALNFADERGPELVVTNNG